MANNYHRPEKVRFILADMKRMGGRTLAYAEQLEELLNPILEQRLKSRDVSRMTMRKYREEHPEYREKCRQSAAIANERRRLERIMVATNPLGTATMCKAAGCPVG